jgi:hypothetical protein
MLIFSGKRFSLKLAVILSAILTSGCFTLKTIPANNIAELNRGRKYLEIHAGDSLWLIEQYKVGDNILTGKIVRNASKTPPLRKADIYIPSSQYLKINDEILTIPLENIGKVDYQIVDAFMIFASTGLFLGLIAFSPLFISF